MGIKKQVAGNILSRFGQGFNKGRGVSSGGGRNAIVPVSRPTAPRTFYPPVVRPNGNVVPIPKGGPLAAPGRDLSKNNPFLGYKYDAPNFDKAINLGALAAATGTTGMLVGAYNGLTDDEPIEPEVAAPMTMLDDNREFFENPNYVAPVEADPRRPANSKVDTNKYGMNGRNTPSPKKTSSTKKPMKRKPGPKKRGPVKGSKRAPAPAKRVANPYSMNPFAKNFSPAAFGLDNQAVRNQDAKSIKGAAAYQKQLANDKRRAAALKNVARKRMNDNLDLF